MGASQFQTFFELGCEHILDYKNGYDHILFVMALCAVYVAKDWRRVLILVTAFTLGHSITLALSTLRFVNVDSTFIEFLIPVTILITAVSNLFRGEETSHGNRVQLNYLFAGGFGLIHGLGFSNYLRELLGKSTNIISQLFAFNLGLEVGQIVIVALFMFVTFLAVDLAGLRRKWWKFGVSLTIALMAIMLIMNTDFLQ